MEKYDTYKDSGIEWIGAIPAHWEVKRLKYLVNDKLKYGANESALYENREDPRYIRITDFGHNGKLKRDTFKSLPLQTAKEYLLESGDILLARSGATVGKTFQFKDYEGLACFAGYLIKASPNEKIVLSDFLYLYTKSSFYDGWKESIFNKATIQNIGADKYAFLEVPLPPKSEQSKIANYLDKKTAEIDDLIAQKKKLLQLYKKEKEVIINQAVTKGINPDVKLKKSGVEYIGQIPEQWDIKKLRYLGN
jgi:type I restriction enzyme S subunit